MGFYGQRLYSIGALGIKSCDYEAYIARFIHSVFEDLTPLLQLIPEDSRQRALHLCADGLSAAKQSITTSRHTMETSAKTLTTAVAIQRHYWLRSTTLSQEAKFAIEDLPFDGTGLFNASTDAMLQEIDKKLKHPVLLEYPPHRCNLGLRTVQGISSLGQGAVSSSFGAASDRCTVIRSPTNTVSTRAHGSIHRSRPFCNKIHASSSALVSSIFPSGLGRSAKVPVSSITSQRVVAVVYQCSNSVPGSIATTTDSSSNAHYRCFHVGLGSPSSRIMRGRAMALWTKHINYLKLMAIFLALQEFKNVLRGQVIQIFSDNTTAVCYLNKQGVVVSCCLCHLAIQIWDFCIARNITPVASHLPVSRGALSTHEMSASTISISKVFQLWGTPDIEVFATAQNKKCHLFCTGLEPTPEPWATVCSSIRGGRFCTCFLHSL